MVHSTPSHPWTVTWTVRLKRTWPWLSPRTRRSRPQIKPGSKGTTLVWSAVVNADRVSCIDAAARLRSQDTMTSGSLQGACADVRHSTHASHSTDRPSHARVAERCWSFNATASRARPVASIWAYGRQRSSRGDRLHSAVSPHSVAPCAAPQHVEAPHASEREHNLCWVAYPFIWVRRVGMRPQASCEGRL